MKVTPANIETYPISYPEAKAFLRLDDDIERDLITNILIPAVVEFAETTIESLLVRRSCIVIYTESDLVPPTGRYELPMGPVDSITAIADAVGPMSVPSLEHVGHTALADLSRVSFTLPMQITYTSGFATIPADLKFALLSHLAHLWKNREPFERNLGDVVSHSMPDIYANHRRSHRVG
jgi:uncharacterized phiE125 gp8 family phage protein